MMNDLKEGAASGSPEFRQSRIRDWAWSPRYAKIWWALAVTFWAAKLASYSVAGLDWLNEPGVAGYLTVAFFPPMMFLVLGFGRVKGGLCNPSLHAACVDTNGDHQSRRKGPSGLPSEIDPLDARSGFYWVSGSMNPYNVTRLNREP